MTGEEVLLLCSKLSVEEQQLFEGGRISTVCFDSWLQERCCWCASLNASALETRLILRPQRRILCAISASVHLNVLKSAMCKSLKKMERPAAARLPKSRQTKKRPAEQAARQPTLKQAARV
eukprot:1158099-Pelagomonas_calceolata.AAC.1